MSTVKNWLLGKPRDIRDPRLFHKISLIAFLAWVGLGADGLSSSAYGPDEAFRGLGQHTEMAVILAIITTVTVFVISFAYSRLIQHFPHGGGGYVVATKLLGPSFGVISGCALLVDYVLTITTSIAAAMDQTFSFLPDQWVAWKLLIEGILIGVLILLNLRGVKESVTVVVPIFLFFIVTHAVVLIGCLISFAHQIPTATTHMTHALRQDVHQMGLWGMFLMLLNAFSRGAGTFTGIEAVSNGVPTMREPKVNTARKTMFYMALSLAITAGGILICYLLVNITPEDGKTLNASLFERLGYGTWFVVMCLLAEAGLLVVAAQTGFIDGPRVMANMALDNWLPRRFSSLSERLTMSQGVLLIGGASLASLLYTKGDVTNLVTMYSINVFITFSLSQLGMCRFWWLRRREDVEWKRALALHGAALTLCFGILTVMVAQKFFEGAWVTLVVTMALIGLCFVIHRHYRVIQDKIAGLSNVLINLPMRERDALSNEILDVAQPTAVVLVSRYNGLGVHSVYAIIRQYSGHFSQFVFASVAVIDSGAFKGEDEINRMESETEGELQKYVNFAQSLGLKASFRLAVGTDPVAAAESLCEEIAGQYSHSVIFGGKLVFRRDNLWQRLLHNETAAAIQRRLQWKGIPMVVLPICVRD
jgi:amino acid transporter